jgi:hypothetical protein
MNSVGSQQLAVDVPLFVIGKESACLTFNFHIIVNRSREGGGRWQRREITHTHTTDPRILNFNYPRIYVIFLLLFSPLYLPI